MVAGFGWRFTDSLSVPRSGRYPWTAAPFTVSCRRIDHCCSSWTSDGKYYVFQATHDNRTQLWAFREADNETGIEQSKPVQITTGALDFRRPTVVDDGRRIFAIGWQLRGEVVHFASTDKKFVTLPGFESTSAE